MLHGRAKIELFDLDGKKVYEQEHSNIITNAYKNIITPNFPLDINTNPQYRLSLKNLTPIYSIFFGGILAFSNEIYSNSDNFMIGKEHFYNFVGNAGGSFSGVSKYRGSYNSAESGYNEETNQIKMVWDFPTNACNGKIKTLALCPVWLGNSGLIKDDEDTTITSILNGFGTNCTDPKVYYKQTYNTHNFPRQNFKEYGYYLFSKDCNTNVYVKSTDDGKGYIFTEVKRNFNLGIIDKIIDDSTAELDNNNLFEFTQYTLSYDYAVQNPLNIQYCEGYIWFIKSTISEDRVVFELHQINPNDYTHVAKAQYTFYISGLSNIYPRYIDGYIYITSSSDDYLYICNPNKQNFRAAQIGDPSYTYVAQKFYDTICLIRTSKKETKNPIYFLDSDNMLCKNYFNLQDESSYGSAQAINKFFAKDDVYNYPIANCSTMNVSTSSQTKEYEYQNQIIMPCLSSINNVNEFVKYNTNTMKITYILEDY